MAKKNSAPTCCGIEDRPAPPLKRQSQWSGLPWKPGEIPAGSFMPVSRPHDETQRIYGHPSMGVEPPKNRGKRPPKEDAE